MRIMNYLSEQGVDFTVKEHEERYTALEEAAAQHISGSMFAKTVILKLGEQCVMLVLPASHRVDLAGVAALLGAEPVMASEEEVGRLFPDCDLGAEPPFGSQYGLSTWVDESLAQQPQIAIRAGNHKEVVLLSYADFARLERPRLARFAEPIT